MPTQAEIMRRLSEAEAQLAKIRAFQVARDPEGIVKIFRNHLDPVTAEQEHFMVAILDSRRKVLRVTTVGIGTVSQVDTHPREVFRDAIRMSGYAIIIAHNHPSGDADPSDGDIKLTTRMCEAGKILGIPVLDHVILAAQGYCSLVDMGVMSGPFQEAA